MVPLTGYTPQMKYPLPKGYQLFFCGVEQPRAFRKKPYHHCAGLTQQKETSRPERPVNIGGGSILPEWRSCAAPLG